MSDKIQGTVLRVLSDQDVVIDKGQEDGVSEGDYIAISGDADSNLEFSENGKESGKLITFKASLRVTQVTDNLAIASTYRMVDVNVGGMGFGLTNSPGLAQLTSPPKHERRIQKIESNEKLDAQISQRKVKVENGDIFYVVPKHVADSGFLI